MRKKSTKLLSLIIAIFMVMALVPFSAITAFAADEVPVTGVNFTMSYAEIPTGKAMGFTAEVLPENATNKKITYTSSDYSVAVVDPSTGKITGMKAGTATITATSQDGNFTDTVEVKVIDGLGETNTVLFYGESTTSPYETQTVGVGNKVRQPAVAPTKEGHVFCGWYTSWECVAPWDFDDTVGTGFYRIYAKFVAEADYVEVSGLSLSVASFTYDLKDNAIYPLTAKVAPENASETPIIKWSVSDPSVVEITENSNNQIYFKGLKLGTATITATTKDGAYSASCVVTVTYSPVTIKEEEGVWNGTNSHPLFAHIDANYSGEKELIWTSSNEDVLGLIVDANTLGTKLVAKKVGTATVTVTTKDGKYSDTCVVTVTDTLVFELNGYLHGGKVSDLTLSQNVGGQVTLQSYTFSGATDKLADGIDYEITVVFAMNSTLLDNLTKQQIKLGDLDAVSYVRNGPNVATVTFTLPELTHTYTNSVLQKDDTHHWLECDAADCPDKFGSIKDKVEHTFSTDFKTDAENHWKECACGAKTENGAHSGGTATCTAKAVCTTCNTAYGEIASHTHGTEFKNDATNHWNECACGDKANVAPHADTNNDEKCDVCSYAMPKVEENDPSAPTPDLPNTNTDKPTDATGSEKDDNTETEAPANNGCGGCGSSAALSAIAIVAVVGSALVIKKKKD